MRFSARWDSGVIMEVAGEIYYNAVIPAKAGIHVVFS